MGMDYESYYNKIKKSLKNKDGFIHTLIVQRSYFLSSENGMDYQKILEMVIENMQNEGYELVDFKYVQDNSTYSTLIIYK